MQRGFIAILGAVIVCSVIGLIYHFSQESKINPRYAFEVGSVKDADDDNAFNSSQPINSTVQGNFTDCKDMISNCSDFGYDTCNDFKEWAYDYCSLYCGICNGQGIPSTTPLVTIPPRVDENCSDLIPNCVVYGTCSGIYEAWARTRCQKYCGFCVLPTPEPCEDDDPECDQLDTDLCWAPRLRIYREQHCKRYCGLCPGQTPKKPPRECKDYTDRCAELGPDVCVNYREWAKYWCSDFCGHCATTTVTTTQEACIDRNPNCHLYTDKKNQCCGDYYSWAKWNCPVWCGFCTPPVTTPRLCVDRNPHCASMNSDLCTNLKFYNFVREYCAGFCKVCDEPLGSACSTSTTITTTPHFGGYSATSPPLNTDVTGKSYVPVIGQTGNPAGNTNFTSGTVYPPGSTEIPGETSEVSTDNPDMSSPYPAGLESSTAPAENECIQNGKNYQQGEKWETPECDKSCECVDALTNTVKCKPLKCPELQNDCVLIRIPGQCCPRLECTFHNPVHPNN